MEKILIINKCDDCCHFDNQYHDYKHTCTMLRKIIEYDWDAGKHHIPSDCPLPTNTTLK